MREDHRSIPAEGAVLVPTAELRVKGDHDWGMATRDHDVIRAWAARHRAEPATGEATSSGPATVNVNDGGVGIRFNFPGTGRFRPISWTEWLDHFDRNRLTFVYQEEVADRAYALWQSRGGDHGHDRQDWFDAERQLRQIADGRTGRYWFVQRNADETKQDR
jgi:hypothetical protein